MADAPPTRMFTRKTCARYRTTRPPARARYVMDPPHYTQTNHTSPPIHILQILSRFAAANAWQTPRPHACPLDIHARGITSPRPRTREVRHRPPHHTQTTPPISPRIHSTIFVTLRSRNRMTDVPSTRMFTRQPSSRYHFTPPPVRATHVMNPPHHTQTTHPSHPQQNLSRFAFANAWQTPRPAHTT